MNVILLALIFFVFARLQFRFELSSALLAPARERIVSVSRLAALQLPDTPRSQWTKLLDGYSSKYPAYFYLFDENGDQLAGDAITLPPGFLRQVRLDPFAHAHERNVPPPPPPEPHRIPDGPRHRSMSDAPLELFKTSNPTEYWIGARIPVWIPDRDDPLHATLVWRFDSLWTEPFFFDYKPWVAVALVVLLVSAACWLPLVRRLTHAISSLTAATRRIANGHFDIKLPVTRRDELGDLSDSINRMAERLAGYVSGQKRFLGDIAHELSSPIARMQMALGVLEHRTSEEDASYVTDVREEVEHMSSLVNELLLFSKAQVMDTGVELEPVNVAATVRRVIEREGSKEVTFQTTVENDLEAVANPDSLFRALANLVRNAVRYAGHAGPIEISAEQHEDQVQIRVADHGAGLPESELENIFRPFYRPEFARQRETGGTGLGLAIVRDCIESCAGRVLCRNRSPHGLEVIIELPLRC